MPQASSAKSIKSSKPSKAAKAILHPKATLAAAKPNSSQPTSAEPATTSGSAKPDENFTSSIQTTSSQASIDSNTAKPLSSVPSVAEILAPSSGTLPVTAPEPSILAPPINTPILTMKKQDIDRKKPVQPAVAPALAPQPPIAHIDTDTSMEPSSIAAATPYNVGDEPSQTEGTVASPVDMDATVESSAAASDATQDVAASPAAAVLASAVPAPKEQPLSEAAAAPTPVAALITNKTAEPSVNAGSTPTAAAEPSFSSSVADMPISANNVITSPATVVEASTFRFPELTRLQHNTFVSRPTDPSRAAIRDLDLSVLPVPLRPLDRQDGLVYSPSHILIFGWMDAPIRLVAKYAQPYTVLFPDATVLIQLSDGKSYLARENFRREQLQRIIGEITSSPTGVEEQGIKNVEINDVGDSTVTLIDHSEARSASSNDGRDEVARMEGLVIHSFSDGGAGNLSLFLDEMACRSASSPKVHSLIMDSSPGKSNPKTGSVAFTMHLSHRPRLRAIVRFLVYIGLYLLQIWTKITGQPARGELMRKRLNSLKSWSWVTASYMQKTHQAGNKPVSTTEYPPRMYMYTKADKLIPWQFVEEHANDLASISESVAGLIQMEKTDEREKLLSVVNNSDGKKEREYRVELRRWDTPPHCSIGRFDFEGYWAAVMDFYKAVLSRGQR